MKKTMAASKRISVVIMVIVLTVVSCCGSVFAVYAGQPAEKEAGFVNISGDGGDDIVSLSASRVFRAYLPVDMTEEEAERTAETAEWSLVRNGESKYTDPDLYPNAWQGGSLDSLICMDGRNALFEEVATGAETKEGSVYLTLTFRNNLYFYSMDGGTGAPHSNGGAYLDICGYFLLRAEADGTELGYVPLKIVPYDNFHTMTEICEGIDEIVALAADKTDLYVERFSMGESQGDNGLTSLDMPYLIVAKDRDAVRRWKAIQKEAENDPASLLEKIRKGELDDYQVPVMYSNVHSNEAAAPDSILGFAEMLVEAAVGSSEICYDRLSGFTEEGREKLTEQMGDPGKKGSVAVPELVKDTATYLGYIHAGTGSPVSGKIDLGKYYNIEKVTVNIDELLDDIFFIIVPEENPEGRMYMTRTSSGGVDLNRDNTFQTQAETQNMTRLIAQWNPVSFAEIHGSIESFQCEPCTPPHEPNFEYDLLAEHLMTGGEAFGTAAVANNGKYNSYVIPQRDYLEYTGEGEQTIWADPWDDMSTGYTPQYAMLHGTVAYTIELPAYDDEAVKAAEYGQLGQSHYVAENKESYLAAQTEIFLRGVTNANSDKEVGVWFCDQYDKEGAESHLFRPVYGENGNFYPECYIIPLDAENQRNLQGANDMMEWLVRNGVTVQLAEESFSYGGTDYPEGTMVVSMYQAKRSVANCALYDGTAITGWTRLYSEAVTAFSRTRGFDMDVCADPDAYEAIRKICGDGMDYADYEIYAEDVKPAFRGIEDALVIIVNASEDSTAAVNSLLKNGESVSFITEGEYRGSFLCDYAAWKSVDPRYVVTGIGIEASEAPQAEKIKKAPRIYISGKPADDTAGFVRSSLVSGAYGYNYDRQAMELLGFQVTEDASEADLIIGSAALDAEALAAVRSGTAYMGYGEEAVLSAEKLFPKGSLRCNFVGGGMNALSYVTYPEDTMINASYIAEGDDILYGYGTAYFSAIPEGSSVLVKLDGEKGFLEGFVPAAGKNYSAFVNDSVQAISYEGEGAGGAELDVVLFANTLTDKVHQRDEFNFISNAAFHAVSGGSGESVCGYKDVAADVWYADAVRQVTEAGVMNGVGEENFCPDSGLPRAAFAQILFNLKGNPSSAAENPFCDVAADAWYAPAVIWSAAEGIVKGCDEENFVPAAEISREQLAVMLYRYAGSPYTGGNLNSFSDALAAGEYAEEALCWAVEQGIINGDENGALNPGGTVTRAQTAQIISRYIKLQP